ncbi:dihydrofolate reductase family protein [Nocardioides ferulae]|uniref:dihydrofolate reductase family protein n=1 Tax=Nocardioides ferulae TaxID=2340821 RepID=UPI000EB0B1EB|nr:dihydrofolate reductase family protein [Nocardioides ferulae]
MRELTYLVAVSLDGRIAGPDGDFSAFPVEGDHMEWLFRDWRDTLPAVALEAMGLEADHARIDCVLMGWNTYAAGFSQGVRDPYPQHEQVVFSRRRGPADVPDGIRVVGSDPVAEVRRLKQTDGVGIWLCGGGQLAGVLADEVDRLVLKVNPFVLGDGPALFDTAYAARSFALTGSTAYGSGVVVNEYRRA